MSKAEYSDLIKNVFEFRYKPTVSFFDWKGSLAEHLLEKLHLNGFRVSNDRIDIANPDNPSFHVFVGVANAGLELENNEKNLDGINEKIALFISALESFTQFAPKEIARVGVRWNILRHKRGIEFEKLKDIFENNIVVLNKSPLSSFSEKIIDIGLPLIFEGSDYKFNLTQGPMNQAQALQQMFTNNAIYLDRTGTPKSFVPKNGFFVDIDVYKEKLETANLADLKTISERFAALGQERMEQIQTVFFDNLN
jgi:hypothetical protein